MTGRNVGRISITTLLLFSAVGGCSSSSQSSIAEADYCAGKYESECRNRVRCGDAHYVESCLQVFFSRGGANASCNAEEAFAVAQGNATYDGELAATCLQELAETASCTAAFSDIDSCRRVYQGKVGVGAACSVTPECADGAYCDVSQGSCPGTCRPTKGAGEAAELQEECSPGLYLRTGSPSECRAPIPSGQPCDPDVGDICEGPGYCSREAQICIAFTREGEACADASCERGLACAEGVCSPRSGAGGACRETAECTADLTCSKTGACELPGAEGEDCYDSTHGMITYSRHCLPQLHCARQHLYQLGSPGDGSCEPLIPEGEACARRSVELGPGQIINYLEGTCADGLFCDDTAGGVCVRQRAAQESCDAPSPDACAPGLRCIEGRCALSRCAPGA